MSDKKPVLSISLLCSGRPETKKCLDSLKPIREAVDTELILVDTGCDEEMHDMLLTYTDQVYKFTWCNDFSKARNAGLERATGEWFLYLDDDEWFTKTDDLIEFFNSGEYKKYGIACYKQRNFLNSEGTLFEDAYVSRMIRLGKKTHFESSIHEYLEPILGDYKLLDSVVDHYGYIFKDQEAKYKHSKRNISLLEDMIKKERKNPRWWGQLAQEYKGIEEYSSLEKLCISGLKEFKNQNDDRGEKIKGTLYTALAIAYSHRYDWEDVIDTYEKSMQDKHLNFMGRMAMYERAANAYFNLKEYDKCEYCVEKYLPLYQKSKDNERLSFESSSFFVRDAVSEASYCATICIYMVSQLKRGEWAATRAHLEELNWEKGNLYVHGNLPQELVSAISKASYEPFFSHVAKLMIRRNGPDKDAIERIQEIEKECEKGGDTTEFDRLVTVFAPVETKEYKYYMNYLRILNADLTGEVDHLPKEYETIFKHVANPFQLKDVVFDIAEKYSIDLTKLMMEIPYDQWKKGVDYFCENTSLKDIQKKDDMIRRVKTMEDIRFDYYGIKAAEASVVYRDPKDPEQNTYGYFHERFERFADLALDFYHQFFKDSAFEGEMALLPESARAAVLLKKELECEENGDIKGAGECLKQLLKTYAPFVSAIQEYTKLYAENKKAALQEEQEAADEMQALAAQLKIRIREMIEQGLLSDALETIRQMKVTFPADKELNDLEEKARGTLS